MNQTTQNPTDPNQPRIPTTMRAAARYRYGGTDVLETVELDMPTIEAETVLIEVGAAAVNPLDWHMMTGTPWLVRQQAGVRRPKQPIIGVDVAGTVLAIGSDVQGIAVGDEVIGAADGSFATHSVLRPKSVVPKPAGVSMDDAAGMVVAGITALQGLRDKADLQPGQNVLINGASGGVGTAAIQLAKLMGAEVTAVCSTGNVDLVRSLGADHVVDYTTEDFADTDRRYDVFFDNQGNRSLRSCRGLLTDQGVYLMIGGAKTNPVFGPMGRMIRGLAFFAFGSKKAKPFIAEIHKDDLSYLAGLMGSGELRTVIDTVYPLDKVPEAMAQLGDGHVRGKLIIKP
jgi:NADPH:quinone reductase-like Zn-dependent oxidoreductase